MAISLIFGELYGSTVKMKPPLPATLLALAMFLLAPRARADHEVWLWLETRSPLLRTETPRFPRIDLRTVTDMRMSGRADGLQQAFFRAGPLFFLTDFLFVGVHGTVYADRLASGVFDQESRFELEPNLFGRFGDFTWNDRNRFEVRFRDSGTRTRYRNQFRLNYAPKNATWIPFFWNEFLVDLAGEGLNQNRAQIGLGRMFSPSTRVDLGLMIRSREDATGWVHDRVINLYLLLDIPPLSRP
ncbi:DUF2490 domain-containing protein [Chondromyces crocatus]|uniref:DUF2490 domain-containing protein n=1 Tax=Chondromyces crocatus TaxID=52 RepID=A0A0K1E7U1_CHOCO|nr:DUF2490 domain-containing protein [Chondromyces crocatus]AKT36929.1 uncharacterized protein CMC5_010500 [Chondromyces crocatus]